MIKTETRNKLPLRNILRALGLDNVFGRPSSLEEVARLNPQDNSQSLNAWIEQKNASLDAERTKAEALMAQRGQRSI